MPSGRSISSSWRRLSTDHDEVAGLLDLDLPPGAGSASGVGRVGPFRDDALEPQLARSHEELLATLVDVLHVDQEVAGFREQLPQCLLPVQQGEWPQIFVVKSEHVEETGPDVGGCR